MAAKKNTRLFDTEALVDAQDNLRGFFKGCDQHGYSLPWLVLCTNSKPHVVMMVLAGWVRDGVVKYSGDSGQAYFTPVKKYFKR